MDGFSDAMHGIIQESIIFEKLIYFLEHRRNSVSKLEKSGCPQTTSWPSLPFHPGAVPSQPWHISSQVTVSMAFTCQ